MKEKILRRLGRTTFALACLLALASAPSASAAGLEVGDELEAFNAIDQDGQLWKASDILGKKNLVIYFYPAAMTGGCTKQACAFRDDAAKLKGLDTVVVGVSGDAPAGLKVFQKTHNLNFTLLSDYDGRIAGMLGVPTREGGSLTREFEGSEVTLERGITTSRWTYVIGKDKKVAYKNTKVDAAADSETVIGFLEKQK